MNRTVCIKLLPDEGQAERLKGLMGHYAAVCTYLAEIARCEKIKNKVELHNRAYSETRAVCGAHAQITCLAMVQVVSAYKALAAQKKLSSGKAWPAVHFSTHGAVSFDRRTYTPGVESFSLYTPEGRIAVPVAMGERQQQDILKGTLQAAHLVHKRNKWFLHISIRRPDVEYVSDANVLGVDVGEINVATTSNGKIFSAKRLRHDRDVFLARRSRLQRNGSQSAKRVLRKVAGRERRRVCQENHVVSKQVVAEALRVRASCIALEDLTHIRARIRRSKRIRARLHRWAWRQLQDFIAYKAEEVGIAVVYVDPAYTSTTCAQCYKLGKRRGSKFSCSCGNLRHADANAAVNISRLAGAIGPATPYVTAGKVA